MSIQRPVPSINATNTLQWKEDVAASVDYYNRWFMNCAPASYRASRDRAAQIVQDDFKLTHDLLKIQPADLKVNPAVVRTLRMCTAPPTARDRLIGLAYVPSSVVYSLERGKLPRLPEAVLDQHLDSICKVIGHLLDRDLFGWLATRTPPSATARRRAATIVADRMCGANADPIIRNSQEKRQIDMLANYLQKKGYEMQPLQSGTRLTTMPAGTFCRLNVALGPKSFIPIDMAIQPKSLRPSSLPILVECKSAGDFANVNKRRKEEADKMAKLKATLGSGVEYILFLCGYFGPAYLGHEAAEGIDWIWEHRIADLDKLGI